MKKLLALVLTLALVFGTFSFAAAATVPADVVGTDYEEAATKLAALGVMIGDDRGFRPDDSITRAEFAVLMVRALGLEAAAKFSTTPTKFADVTDAYSWAWGYINVAVEQGVIKGYSETAYGPADPVTYEQAITMIVRGLGYEPAVVGGYPAGYLAKAAELDITEDVTVTAGVGAPRGAVAQMLANALEVDLMERKTFGDEANYEAVDKNLLKNKIGVKVIEATVDSVDDDEITFVDAAASSDNGDYTLAEGVVADHLIGMAVVAWKYNSKIVYIENDSDLVYDYIASLTDENGVKEEDDGDGIAGTTIAKIELLNADKTYKMAADYDLLLDETDVADTALEVGQFAKFVLDGSKVLRVEAYNLNAVVDGMIEEVDEDYVQYLAGTTEGKKFRIKDYEDLKVVIDGKVAKYDDLEEGMVFSAYKNGDNYFIVATEKKAEGELTSYKSGSMKVAGKSYDRAGSMYFSTDMGEDWDTDSDVLDDMLGEEVVAYLNTKGEAAYVKADVEETTSSFYAYVDKAWSGEYDYVRLLNNKGETVSYKLDEDEINDAETDGSYNDINVPSPLTNLQGNIYKFYVDEDGYVVDIDAPATTDTFAAGDVDSFSDKNDTITIDGTIYYVTGSTVIFDFTDTDDRTVVAWDDIKGSEKLADLAGSFGYDSQRKLNYVAFTDGLDKIGADDVYVAFVLDKYKVTSTKYDFDLKLLGGDEETVRIHKDDVNGADKEEAVLYTLNSDGTGVIEAAWNAWYDMGPLAAEDADYDEDFDTLTSDDDVDDDMIHVGGTWYRVAKDALIYEVVYDGAEVDEFEEADLGDIDANDDVSIFTIDGVIKLLFFKSN